MNLSKIEIGGGALLEFQKCVLSTLQKKMENSSLKM